MVFQAQELVLPPGNSGQITYGVTLPSSGVVSGAADTAGAEEQVVLNYGVGGCNSLLFDDCTDIPCMGPRLTMHPTAGAPVEIVNDGTDPVNDGCEPFTVTPGSVALIDRGACTFSVKGKNATDAGASGVIIANTVDLGSLTPTGDSIMTMGCTDAVCHSLIIIIPGAFISYNAGEALKTSMDAGDVTVFLGVREEDPEHKQTKAYIWETTADPTDIDDSNDRYTETTVIDLGIFSDGFESGDTTRWLGSAQ